MYEYYDPSQDPRFVDNVNPNDFDKDAKIDTRTEEMDMEAKMESREEDMRNHQLEDAYKMIRDSVSYDDFKALQGELRAGRMTNNDVLELARELSDYKGK